MLRVVYGVIGAVLLISQPGCDSSLDTEDLVLASKPIQPKNPDPARAARDTGSKLQPYIKCINRGIKSVDRSRSRYLSWIKDPKVGPTCKERHVYGTYKLYSAKVCTDDLLKANKMSPKMPKLEAGAAAVAKAVKVLDPLLKDANTYYSTKGYKGDDCKKGKLLHIKLMAAFAVYDKGKKEMMAEVRAFNEKVLAQALVDITKKYGTKHPRYFHRKLARDAKATLNVLRAQRFSKDAKPGMDKVKAAVSGLRALYAKAEKAPKTGGGAGYSIFISATKRYLEAAQEFVDKRASGDPKWSRTERRWLKRSSSAWLVKGSFERVLRRYNDMIDRFNSVRFR